MKLTTELNTGAWFDMPDDPDGARVCLRVMAIGILKKIHKETTSKKTEYKKLGRGRDYQRFEYDDPDEEKREQLLWDYCITDWEGIFDTDGTGLECTNENKIKLMNGSVEFALFIGNCLETLNMAQDKDREDEGKN